MNDDDMSIVIGHDAAADTITISADDLSTIDLSDIKINTADIAQPGPWNRTSVVIDVLCQFLVDWTVFGWNVNRDARFQVNDV